MNEILQEYALIAEIISAMAVIISLIFVGFQIRDNTKATQASTFHEITTLDIQLLLSFANSKESARIVSCFRASPDSLTEEEYNQGFYFFAAEVRHVENLFLQHKNKMLNERDWNSRKALVEGVVQSPGFGALLKSPFLQFFDGSFIEFGVNQREKLSEIKDKYPINSLL
ncbi:hypothetical protein [Flagellimonas meridianipacifica]|uniref:Uncharacterized protein n=1 Tax=Flagellimonas meridianipacifica TaxID=1080225 RepID=A0A2T0MF81_9FLAO|nr:hypothetical protein [Allomuricauda pacifica]PRX56228.1 hypothetical protein CLV81_0222 [Allomuricauda pacifica]